MGWTKLGRAGRPTGPGSVGHISKLVDVEVTGILDLLGQGMIRTARSGNRIEITSEDNDRIVFVTGVEAANEIPAYIQANASTGTLVFYSKTSAPPAPQQSSISLDPDEISIGGARAAVNVWTPNDEIELAAASVDFRTNSDMLEAENANIGPAEIFPLGTYIAAGELFDTTGWTYPAAAAQVLSLSGGGQPVACDYNDEPVVVFVTMEAEITGLTQGEWHYLRPTVNGTVLGGGLLRDAELPNLAAVVHSAGVAPGLGHAAGGTANTGGSGALAHAGGTGIGLTHSSAGAHTHSGYTGYFTCSVNHRHTISSDGGHTGHGTHTIADHASHVHSGPSHSDHGTHTIADHPVHTHLATYTTLVRSGVYVGTLGVGVGSVTFGAYGRTQATAATVGRVAFHYLILRG